MASRRGVVVVVVVAAAVPPPLANGFSLPEEEEDDATSSSRGARAQIRTLLSAPPVTKRVPEGWTSTAKMDAPWVVVVVVDEVEGERECERGRHRRKK